MSFSLSFKHVYLQNSASIVSKKERKGPYGHYFDQVIGDSYFHEKSFELGEVKMIQNAIELAIKKSNLQIADISLAFGGDLSNQLAITSLALSAYDTSLIGVYSACATISASLGLAATYIEYTPMPYNLAFTSSNYAVAERQFRYPNDYGIQKKETTTSTVTGAASFILGKKKSPIKITGLTYGNVYDSKLSNVNDLGTPMAYAAYHTIKEHLINNKESWKDYDLILTGDLSLVGSKVLKECFAKDGIDLANHQDAGLMIYHREEEKTYAGGSGPACIAAILASYIIQEMLAKRLRRVLVAATGALFSPTIINQKNNIMVTCHIVTLEVTK